MIRAQRRSPIPVVKGVCLRQHRLGGSRILAAVSRLGLQKLVARGDLVSVEVEDERPPGCRRGKKSSFGDEASTTGTRPENLAYFAFDAMRRLAKYIRPLIPLRQDLAGSLFLS